MELREFFKRHPRAALGFSGGTDSAYLLYAAGKCGAEVVPYYVKTAFQPRFEYEDAAALCRELGIELRTVDYDILSLDRAAKNPPDRCYHCKRAIFSRIAEEAKEDGLPLVIDGTNASDDLGDRPGAKALAELGVRSPLRECGLTKPLIRRLSAEAGLFTAGKPSNSCLATRIPSGEPITADLLERIELSEDALFRLGFSDFRVRYFHGAARLQLRCEQIERAAARHGEIRAALGEYFDAVLLDTEVRISGDV